MFKFRYLAPVLVLLSPVDLYDASASDRGGVVEYSNESSQEQLYSIEVCNRIGETLYVAYVAIPVGQQDFITKGWAAVDDGDCGVVIQSMNPNVLLYGSTIDGSFKWEGPDGNFCIRAQAFEIPADGSSCPADYDPIGFSAYTATGPGNFSVTFSR